MVQSPKFVKGSKVRGFLGAGSMFTGTIVEELEPDGEVKQFLVRTENGMNVKVKNNLTYNLKLVGDKK